MGALPVNGLPPKAGCTHEAHALVAEGLAEADVQLLASEAERVSASFIR